MTSANSLPLPAADWALFLDVDGTLIEIADTPDGVGVGRRTLAILTRLSRRFGDAVALVSGRPIAKLDALFAPLRLPAAGLHGLERRAPGRAAARAGERDPRMDDVCRALRRFARRDPGLLIEDKGLTVALHYRRAPRLEADAKRFAARLLRRIDGRMILQQGKMVLEFRPEGPNKGDIVERFMAEPPFAGRTPVFIGDDVTDEDGFAAVNRLGGHSIRVGDGAETVARWRVDGVDRLLDWLEGIASQPEETHVSGVDRA